MEPLLIKGTWLNPLTRYALAESIPPRGPAFVGSTERTSKASDVLKMSQDKIELIDEYVPLESINIPGNRVSFTL